MNFVDTMWRPNKAVDAAARKRRLGESITVLLIAAVFMAIAVALMFTSLGSVLGELAMGGAAIAAVMVFLIVLIGGLIIGFFLQKLMEALGTKADYYAGVSSIAYSMMPLATGVLIAGILGLIPIVGIVLALLIATPFILMGAATMYYSMKTFFRTDMITAMIAFSAFMFGIVIVLYIVIIPAMLQTAGMLGGMLPGMMPGMGI